MNKKTLEIKNSVTKMKNVFDGLINRFDMIEERTSEPEEMSVQTSKTERQREKGVKKYKIEYPKTVGKLQKV